MFALRGAIFVLAALPGFCADWNPQLAAQYLDSRQKEWFAWKTAASPDGPCVSCHTGLTYLLARPALRRKLGESEATVYEKGLLGRLRANAGAKPAGALQSVEAIFTALFVGAETDQAFEQLWALQLQEGETKGAWRWYSANLDPWETPDSVAFGAAIAGLALGGAPAEYRVHDHVSAVTDYLQSGFAARPLHSRLAILWASTKLPAALPEPMRQPLIDEIFQKQQTDGGWTIESLGPWAVHPDAPPHAG